MNILKNSPAPFFRLVLLGSFVTACSLGRALGFTAFVTTTAGDNSAGSLGAAISQVDANGGGTIDFSGVTGGTINQTSLLPTLTQSATLLGNNVTVNGPASVVFNFQNAVSMTQLTLGGAMALSISGSGSNVNLTGANSYGGGTTVSSLGLVGVGADNNLGVASTLTLDNGTLRTSAGVSFDPNRNMVLTANGGTFDTNGQISSWNGLILPSGPFNIIGGGALSLTNNSVSLTSVSVSGGATLSVSDSSNYQGPFGFGSSVTLTLNNGTLQNTGTFLDMYQHSLVLGSGGGTFNTTTGNDTILDGVSGTGTLIASGPGTLSLTTSFAGEKYTYTGGTVVQAGAFLQVSTDSLGQACLGPGPVTLDGGTLGESGQVLRLPQSMVLTGNGGKLAVDQLEIDVNGVVSGSGPLTITADNPVTSANCYDCNGNVFLNANNTNTGGIYVTGHTLLNIQTDNNLGAAGAPVTLDNGNFQDLFNDFSTSRNIYLVSEGGIEPEAHNDTFSGTISGPGFLLLKDGGSVSLTNAGNSYGGGTSIIEFTVGVVGADSNFGSSSGGVTLNDGGIQVTAGVSFNPSRNLDLEVQGGYFDMNGFNSSWNDALTGPGDFKTLSTNGSGSLTLTQQATYGGNTDIADFVIDGGGGAPPATAGPTRLVLGVAGALPSSTAVLIGWDGVLDLNGLPQTIGSLQGVTTALVAMGGGSLNVGNDNTNTLYAGVVSGTGKLTKVGTGTLTLDGVSAYTGGTDIKNGVLEVGDIATLTAAITGPVTVENGGILEGFGTVSGAVTNGGMVQVTAPSGALSITQLTDGTASQTGFHVLPASYASGQLHLGNGSLAGALTVTADPGSYAVRYKYVLLTAGTSITGNFASVSDNLSYMTPSLLYGANAVTLVFTRNNTDFTASALTSNQTAVGLALNQSVAIATDVFADKLNELYFLPADQQRTGLSQMGGSSYAPLAAILLNNTQMNLDHVFQQSTQASLGLSSQVDPKSNLWFEEATPFGIWNGDGATDVVGYRSVGFGFIAGNDNPIGKNLRAGWALGYAHLGLTSTDSGSVQTGVDTYWTGGYGNYSKGPLVLAALAAVGSDQYATTRTVALGSDVSHPQSNFKGFRIMGAVRASYRLLNQAAFSIGPFLGGQYCLMKEDGFSETSGGSLDLTVAGQTYNSIRPEAGFSGAWDWTMGPSTRLGLSVESTVSREWGDAVPQIQAGFQDASGISVTTSGRVGADPLLIGAGAGLKLEFTDFNVFAHYAGYFGAGQTSHNLNGGVNFDL